MADNLAKLESLRDALENARFSGIRQVSHQGKTVSYGSDADMAAALAALERKIQLCRAPTVSTVRFHTSKGLTR